MNDTTTCTAAEKRAKKLDKLNAKILAHFEKQYRLQDEFRIAKGKLVKAGEWDAYCKARGFGDYNFADLGA